MNARFVARSEDEIARQALTILQSAGFDTAIVDDVLPTDVVLFSWQPGVSGQFPNGGHICWSGRLLMGSRLGKRQKRQYVQRTLPEWLVSPFLVAIKNGHVHRSALVQMARAYCGWEVSSGHVPWRPTTCKNHGGNQWLAKACQALGEQ